MDSKLRCVFEFPDDKKSQSATEGKFEHSWKLVQCTHNSFRNSFAVMKILFMHATK